MGIQSITNKISGLFLAGIFLLASCSQDTGKKEKDTAKTVDTQKVEQESFEQAKIYTPTNGAEFTIGDSLLINLRLPQNDNLDSISVLIDGYRAYFEMINDTLLFVNTSNFKVGKRMVNVFSYKNGEQKNDYVVCFFKSEIIPEVVVPKVVKTYPHSTKSYTQGLLFDGNQMYESTGQWGESATKQIDFKTGKVLKQYSLPSDVFGEGIVVYKDEIIQLTWKSQTAYVIDKNTFELKNTFSYDTQGWGITNYGDKLIMSDGSNKLFVVEPNTFAVIGEIEVYDNKSAVYQLNELEIIDGLIYANIYLTTKIAVIDPNTGKVLKYIDAESITPKKYRNESDLVLNGIAYNKETKKLYITGKRWNVLFEIKI